MVPMTNPEERTKRKYVRKNPMVRDLNEIPSLNTTENDDSRTVNSVTTTNKALDDIEIVKETVVEEKPTTEIQSNKPVELKRSKVILPDPIEVEVDAIPISYEVENKKAQLMEWDVFGNIDKEWLRIKEEEAFETCGSKCYNFTYLKNGMFGEMGELYDLVKRVIRGDYIENNTFNANTFRIKFLFELGDVLWYIAVLNRLFLLHNIEDSCLNISFDSLNDTKTLIVNNNINDLLDLLHIHAILFINTQQVDSVILIIDAIARLYGSNIKEVGKLNYDKLQKRLAENKLKGSGSDR